MPLCIGLSITQDLIWRLKAAPDGRYFRIFLKSRP